MKFFFIIVILIRQCDGKFYEKRESKFVKGTPSMKFHKVTLLNCISRCALNNFHTINSNADEHNEGDCHCFTDLYETEEKSKWTIMHVHKEPKSLISEKHATRITDGEKKFCLEPERGECNPSDNTPVVYRKLSSHCLTDASVFIYDSDHGFITHACSGKQACPLGHPTDSSKLVLHKSCPDTLVYAAWRTMFGSIQYGDWWCLFPDSDTIIDGSKVKFSYRSNYMSSKAKFIFPEYGMEAKVKMQYYKLLGDEYLQLDDIHSHSDFPDNPIEEGYVDNMATLSNFAERHQARLTAYFLPPQTGSYQFALTVKDRGELFIGSEPDVAGKTIKQKIIDVSNYVQENRRFGFDAVPNQKSSSIYLKEGKRYFLEGIMSAGIGNDYLTIAVHLPNGTFIQPITDQYLDRV